MREIEEIILWRHGQAGYAASDMARALTQVGFYQAQATADWLKRHKVDFPVYCSQALRAQQTASCYTKKFAVKRFLNPDLRFQKVSDGVETITDKKIVIVGHLPWISEFVGTLMGNDDYLGVSLSELFYFKKNHDQWQLVGHFTP